MKSFWACCETNHWLYDEKLIVAKIWIFDECLIDYLSVALRKLWNLLIDYRMSDFEADIVKNSTNSRIYSTNSENQILMH